MEQLLKLREILSFPGPSVKTPHPGVLAFDDSVRTTPRLDATVREKLDSIVHKWITVLSAFNSYSYGRPVVKLAHNHRHVSYHCYV